MADWSSFIVDEWQWSITWGWYQLALGVLCSTTIFMGMRRAKSLPALILLITSYWSAFVVYLIFIICASLYMIKCTQISVNIISNSSVTLCFGIFFTLLQAFFLQITHGWYRVKLQCALFVTLAGNGIAAMIAFGATYIMHSQYIIKIITSLDNSLV